MNKSDFQSLAELLETYHDHALDSGDILPRLSAVDMCERHGISCQTKKDRYGHATAIITMPSGEEFIVGGQWNTATRQLDMWFVGPCDEEDCIRLAVRRLAEAVMDEVYA